jgi:predicted Fe-S protein YdhL (DUF1289 family)
MQEPGFDDDYPDFSVEEEIAEWTAMTQEQQQAIIDQNMKIYSAFLMMDDDHW